MINKKKLFRLSKESVILFIGILFLLLMTGFLHKHIEQITKDNAKNLAALNQVIPGFNNQALGQLRQDINQLEAGLISLAYLFDPSQREIRKDYDMPIYFIEELSNIKESLKTKASNKNLSYPDLGFKETLPDEKEARYLLKQLYVIRDVVNNGMESAANFSSATPMPQEDSGIYPGIKLLKTHIEFSAKSPVLIDFLIKLSEMAPLVEVESILVKLQDSAFKTDISLSNIVIEADWKDKPLTASPINVKEVFSGEDKIINSLRANNPFSLAKAQEPAGPYPETAVEQPKQLPRFLYMGKATLKSKEVAAIQDMLSQETIFLAQGEQTGDFMLKELKESQIILKNVNTGQEIIVKRQEE